MYYCIVWQIAYSFGTLLELEWERSVALDDVTIIGHCLMFMLTPTSKSRFARSCVIPQSWEPLRNSRTARRWRFSHTDNWQHAWSSPWHGRSVPWTRSARWVALPSWPLWRSSTINTDPLFVSFFLWMGVSFSSCFLRCVPSLPLSFRMWCFFLSASALGCPLVKGFLGLPFRVCPTHLSFFPYVVHLSLCFLPWVSSC